MQTRPPPRRAKTSSVWFCARFSCYCSAVGAALKRPGRNSILPFRLLANAVRLESDGSTASRLLHNSAQGLSFRAVSVMTTIPTKIAKIGKYDVLGVIGQGGMGMVYKAVDPVIGRLVAIKMVTTGVSDQPDLLRRFQLEAKST